MRAIEISKSARAALLCAAVLSVGACTAPPPGGGGGGTPVTSGPPDGDTTRFRQVLTDGGGCAGRSSNTSVSGDGLVFTTTFSTYELRIGPGQAETYRDCNVAIQVHVPSGRSVSLQSFHYSGFAFLDPGVRGYLQTAYWFEGSPVAPRSLPHGPMVGPADSEFLYTDDVPVNDAVWTPCGVDRVLQIATRLTLQSSNPQGSGYVNLSAIDGSSRVEARVESRPC